MQKHKAIVALDFDDTIVETSWPHINGFRPNAKASIEKLIDNGCYIIINTCRSGQQEQAAANFLRLNGVHFDQINANHPALIVMFGTDCRKISADIYVDDKNIQSIIDPKSHDLKLVTDQIVEVINRPGFKSMLAFAPLLSSTN